MSSALSLTVKVQSKRQEALDICSFELIDPDGKPLPSFSAGAHIDVQVHPGLIRQYSLCNPPHENQRYLIGVLKDPQSRGGSVGMHEGIHEGDLLTISPPKNHFPLVNAQKILLMAGGIGITPMLCMAERLQQLGTDFALHYCARGLDRMAFYERITKSPFHHRASFHLDSGEPDQKLDMRALIADTDPQTHVYVCGPKGFIDYVLGTCKAANWPAEQLHVEYFAGAVVDHSADDAFEVEIASTGAVYTIPAERNVVEVLEEHGIEIMYSCSQGVCGTCITRVLDGIPDHRDLYLDEVAQAANDQFTPCCSRAKSKRLVLDL